MKRFITLFAILAMLFSFTGCNKEQSKVTAPTAPPTTAATENKSTEGSAIPSTPSPEETSPEESTAPEGTVPEPSAPEQEHPPISQKPLYAVSLTKTFTEDKAQSGATLFYYSRPEMSLILPEPEVADKILLDFLRKMDIEDQHAEYIRTNYISPNMSAPENPMFYNVLYTPIRFDSSVLSLHSVNTEFLGLSRGYYFGKSVTYDLLTGNELSLTDILTPETTAEHIIALIKTQLPSPEDLLPNYEDELATMFSDDLSSCEFWYLSDEGLCFYFDPNTLSSFAAGMIKVEIPYNKLVSILRDAYFPAEDDLTSGTLEIDTFSLEAQSQFTQFSEVVVSENGKKLLLYTSGELKDFNIEIQYKDSDASAKTETYTALSAYTLTPGDAIMIEFDADNTELIVKYRSADQNYTKIISANDGAISIS